MAAVVFSLAILLVVVLFSVQNALPVSVTFLSWTFQASLAVVMFLSVLAGLLVGSLITVTIMFRRSRRKRAAAREAERPMQTAQQQPRQTQTASPPPQQQPQSPTSTQTPSR
ncbi:MAG TPA: LapA family protein [Dissulfurispiraceae bacterium]|nr:LapA family protein [Dissulfurispiraceae bacterium]